MNPKANEEIPKNQKNKYKIGNKDLELMFAESKFKIEEIAREIIKKNDDEVKKARKQNHMFENNTKRLFCERAKQKQKCIKSPQER